MTKPPAWATELLVRLGPEDESFIGDLVEEYEGGRSRAWYLPGAVGRRAVLDPADRRPSGTRTPGDRDRLGDVAGHLLHSGGQDGRRVGWLALELGSADRVRDRRLVAVLDHSPPGLVHGLRALGVGRRAVAPAARGPDALRLRRVNAPRAGRVVAAHRGPHATQRPRPSATHTVLHHLRGAAISLVVGAAVCADGHSGCRPGWLSAIQVASALEPIEWRGEGMRSTRVPRSRSGRGRSVPPLRPQHLRRPT